ncbi:hypothetical protein YC2023_027405 [Brassica napus]
MGDDEGEAESSEITCFGIYLGQEMGCLKHSLSIKMMLSDWWKRRRLLAFPEKTEIKWVPQRSPHKQQTRRFHFPRLVKRLKTLLLYTSRLLIPPLSPTQSNTHQSPRVYSRS